MKQQLYREYLNTESFYEIKKAYIRKKGYFCEKCGQCFGLQLHHLNYDQQFGKEKETDLMLLCSRCHNYMHQDIECFNKISYGNQKKLM